MPTSLALLLALATLSAGAQAQITSQIADQAGQAVSPSNNQPAPIIRNTPAPGIPGRNAREVQTIQPIPGVILRSAPGSTITTVSANAGGTEIRLDHGRANLQIFHPASNSQITVDMPGGQTDIVKDGLYTFNADTNTVRVLHGEADAYLGSSTEAKPIKVKEDHEFSFTANAKPLEADPRQMSADLLPGGAQALGDGYANRSYGGPAYGPYGDGFYDYPYPVAYGFGPWGYPYGYGYPYGFGLGLGFGYYGGFRGGFGGYRGFHR